MENRNLFRSYDHWQASEGRLMGEYESSRTERMASGMGTYDGSLSDFLAYHRLIRSSQSLRVRLFSGSRG